MIPHLLALVIILIKDSHTHAQVILCIKHYSLLSVTHAYVHVCYVCMYVRMYACTYLCMYACMYACMHVCMHVGVCVRIFVCIYCIAGYFSEVLIFANDPKHYI